MKVVIKTLGCKVNAYESELIMERFKSAGYEITDNESEADEEIIYVDEDGNPIEVDENVEIVEEIEEEITEDEVDSDSVILELVKLTNHSRLARGSDFTVVSRKLEVAVFL